MAYQITSNGITFTPEIISYSTGSPVLQPDVFQLVVEGLSKDNKIINIPYTDFAFFRSDGIISKKLTVRGTETHTDRATIKGKVDILESLNGLQCTIDYEDYTAIGFMTGYSDMEIRWCSVPGYFFNYVLNFEAVLLPGE